MADNPFVPFPEVCELLRNITFLKHKSLSRVMVSDHLTHFCLLALLEVSEEPLGPSFVGSKLLLDLLKAES